jgi:D-aminopeptidase
MKRRNFIKGTLCGFSALPSKVLIRSKSRGSLKKSILDASQRRRLRELGIHIGTMETGPYNAITDVAGVKVGHTTIIRGEGETAVRTGVTVIIPHAGNICKENVFASFFNLNGWGEMTGISEIENTGRLETPIFLTGTYNVGIVYSAAVNYLSRINPKMGDSYRFVSPVVAECFDDFLSDTRSRSISERDVFEAIEKAQGGAVAEGAVGGGTGMTSFGFKGGIGTSSRRVKGKFVVGVLVMTNTASRNQLRIDGVPVGKEIKGFLEKSGKTKSIILIAATDAPLLPYQLKKIAKRVALGLAQTGAISQTSSGDILLAFSTAYKISRKKPLPFHNINAINDFKITPFYQATVEATQEAIINALTSAQTTVGRDGNTSYGIPLDQVEQIMKKYMRIGIRSHE